MKYFIRSWLFQVFALWLVSEIIPALVIVGSWQTILIAGFVLSLLMLFIRPLLKILFIPINLLTLGLLSWIINAIVLYLLTVLVPSVEIRAWTFPGYTGYGFGIPSVYINYYLALIISSVSITAISNLLHAVSES